MNKSTKPLPHHINDFLDWLDIERGLSSKTQENYARFLKRFFNWLKMHNLSNLYPHKLTSKHIWDYRIFLARKTSSSHSSEPLKKSTQNYYLIALRSLLNYFSERNILSLPQEKVKLAREKDEESVRFLTLEQIENLCEIPNTKKINEARDRAILEVFFSTGMRIAELVALNRKQIKNSNEGFELGIIGKGGRARTVYFSKRATQWLTNYLNIRDDTEEPLFINYRSRKSSTRRLTPQFIERMVKKYALMAGLPVTTTPHTLRHSFATDLLGKGVDIRILQEFLGHKNISATQIYAHVTNKQLKDIHKKFHGI